MLSPTRAARRWLWAHLTDATSPYPHSELSRSAIVFSPHCDDETLGCGGTIIAKRRAGAEVHVVFLTDGGASHAALMAPSRLAALRRSEGVAACAELGVSADRVHLLGFEDGNLEGHRGAAVRAVSEIVRRVGPAEVFLPHADEPGLWSTDHRETRAIVLDSLRSCTQPTVVSEYPIWYWLHWPWVRWRRGCGAEKVAIARLIATRRFGWRDLRDFNCRVEISSDLQMKRRALEQHRSQMIRLGGAEWPILGDIAGGEFLECFFRDQELFRRSTI